MPEYGVWYHPLLLYFHKSCIPYGGHSKIRKRVFGLKVLSIEILVSESSPCTGPGLENSCIFAIL